ncbi:helix-turn-helix domain-containing protein [Collinsella provencensis]|uniref:helix-turn-helix domain-containing protein n=1 Tax=Collinsella provencensis TaxID=1937461 RepID=UPI000C82CF7F|nr:helix-turn-helix domain-containing protein [Collinsella provencensis]
MEKIASARDLGQAIRHERKLQGYTQEEVAAFSGVGITFISNLERGKGTSEFDKALAVAQILGIDLFAKRR